MSKFEKLNVDIRKEHGTSAARRTRLQNYDYIDFQF